MSTIHVKSVDRNYYRENQGALQTYTEEAAEKIQDTLIDIEIAVSELNKVLQMKPETYSDIQQIEREERACRETIASLEGFLSGWLRCLWETSDVEFTLTFHRYKITGGARLPED